jgi:hypothetical protein
MLRRTCSALAVIAIAAFAFAACGGGDEDCAVPGGDGCAPVERTDPKPPEGIRGNDAGESAGQAEGTLEVRLAHADGSVMVTPDTSCTTRASDNTCSRTITCPAKTDDVDTAALCAWLAGSGREALTAEVPEHQACTMQYGGPETLTVKGTIDGTKVDAKFTRADGCAIARFESVAPVYQGVPIPTAGGGAAAGSCLAQDPDAPVSSDDRSTTPGSNADDTSCGTPPPPTTHEPEIIDDPPSAFEH